MLKQLTLENWKSFRHAVLPIDPLTVLIGTNASGKSNAIEALEFLNRMAWGQEIQASLTGDSKLIPIRGGAEWATLKHQTKFTLRALLQGEDDFTDYLYSITVETQPYVQLCAESLVKIENHSNTNKTLHEIYLFQTDIDSGNFLTVNLYEDKGTIETDRLYPILSLFVSGLPLKKEVTNDVKIVLKTLQNIFVLEPNSSKMRDYSRLSNSLQRDASNIAGVLASLPDEQKAQVELILSKYVRDLPERDIQRVWAETVGRFNSDAMLYCEEQWTSNQLATVIDARGMSDGTLRFLAIVTALLTRPEGSQLVIEDVDNGLHPSRSELLVKMLREIGEQRKIDILVTTHNPALLDALGSEIVPFVVVAHRDADTGESQLTFLENIDNFSKLFASASLGQLTVKGAIESNLAAQQTSMGDATIAFFK